MGGWNQQLEHTFDVVHGSQVTMPSWMASVGGVDWGVRDWEVGLTALGLAEVTWRVLWEKMGTWG